MIITITLSDTADKTQIITDLSSAGYQATIRESGNYIDVISDDYDAVMAICKPYMIQPSDEQKWEGIKSQRNTLLASCDWTQLPDVPLTTSQKIEWQIYRQSLRDITDTYANPDDVIFPTEPI